MHVVYDTCPTRDKRHRACEGAQKPGGTIPFCWFWLGWDPGGAGYMDGAIICAERK